MTRNTTSAQSKVAPKSKKCSENNKEKYKNDIAWPVQSCGGLVVRWRASCLSSVKFLALILLPLFLFCSLDVAIPCQRLILSRLTVHLALLIIYLCVSMRERVLANREIPVCIQVFICGSVLGRVMSVYAWH